MPMKDPPIVAKLVNSSFTKKDAVLTSEESAQLTALILNARRVLRQNTNTHALEELQKALEPFVVKEADG